MRQLICGKNTVLEALKSGVEITDLYLEKKIKFDINKNIKIHIFSKQELNKLIEGNHQGFVAKIKEFNYYGLQEVFKDKPQKVLMLDHIQDPHNFGAIIRSANASGIKHIIIPKERQVKVTYIVSKVASGGLTNMKIISTSSLNSTVLKLKKNNYWIYATALENSVPLKEASINYPCVIVVGNENKGVSNTLQRLSDQIIRIKMKGTVQSLNVSVAAGIILFNI